MTECWDLFDQNRQPLSRVHLRGIPMVSGEYHVVVEIWTVNSNGEILLTLRAPEKKIYPNKWENTRGSALAGETSKQGAVRELGEETGIFVTENELVFFGTYIEEPAFVDTYLLHKDIPISELIMQEGETVDAQWVTLERLDNMMKDETLALPVGQRLNHLRTEFEKQLFSNNR